MSIKPSVVYIKGVHSTTGSDQTSDIGFPNIGLDKLFEGTILKEYTGDYDPSKEYVYKSTTSNVAIENEYHFNCIKNGYNSIADVDHYYTLDGNNYIYNTADTSTWEGKWTLSNAIKNKELYSINSEADRIHIINDGYYEKNDNNYVKQTVKSYNLYKEGQQVLCDDDHKYKQEISRVIDDEGNMRLITVWKKVSDSALAITGFYLLVDETTDTSGNQIYNVRLCNLTFDSDGVTSDEFSGVLYKLDTDNSFHENNQYIKNGNELKPLTSTNMIFNTNPAEISNFYLYQKLKPYTYPNTVEPEIASLYTESNSFIYENFNINTFPVYETAKKSIIPITPYISYTIYEKTAVKVGYYYSNKASSLQFVFTDKTIPDVLKACGLPDSVKKYVHLTNLEYNK